MKRSLLDKLGHATATLWALTAIVILLLVLCLSGQGNISVMNTFAIPNVWLLLIGAVVCVGLMVLYRFFGQPILAFVNQWPKRTITLLSVMLLAVQAYVFYQIFFQTGWDSGVVVDTAWKIFTGQDVQNYQGYFSCYPNNLLLVWLYRILFAVNACMGDVTEPIYFVILFQCLVSVLAGGLLFSVIKKMTKIMHAYLVWLVYVVHVALSPWISILYSDAVALLFPILIIWLYQKSHTVKHGWLCWFGIGLAGYIGFQIKPQTAIALIAVGIVELVSWFARADKKVWLTRIKNTISCLVAFAISMILIVEVIIPSLPMNLDEEKKIGFPHFIMMGLNRETAGVYSDEDVLFSMSYNTKAERTRNNLWMIRERIREYGFGGLMDHMSKKTNVIYGDGTYAWQKEGGFHRIMYEDRNHTLSPALKSFYYGSNIEYFKSLEQIIWLTLLLGSCGIFFWSKSEKGMNPVLFVMILSLFGLTAFECLFEARARYLFLYSPIYIAVALFGWIGWKRAVGATVRSLQGKRRKQS